MRKILAAIIAMLAASASADALAQTFPAMGASAVGSTPERLGALLRADSEKWGGLIREAGIRAE
jgi:hypothetical protein